MLLNNVLNQLFPDDMNVYVEDVIISKRGGVVTMSVNLFDFSKSGNEAVFSSFVIHDKEVDEVVSALLDNGVLKEQIHVGFIG